MPMMQRITISQSIDGAMLATRHMLPKISKLNW
jgi:hypothetical protein